MTQKGGRRKRQRKTPEKNYGRNSKLTASFNSFKVLAQTDIIDIGRSDKEFTDFFHENLVPKFEDPP